jgi:hypothetical protein
MSTERIVIEIMGLGSTNSQSKRKIEIVPAVSKRNQSHNQKPHERLGKKINSTKHLW